MNSLFHVFIYRLPFLFLFLLLFSHTPIAASDIDEEIKRLKIFSQVYHLINREYVNSTDRQRLIDNAIAGMINQLDDYSMLLSSEEVEAIESASVGKLVGIGIGARQLDGQYTVIKVHRGSPAARAGIIVGDIIQAIEDTPLSSMSEEAVRQLITGKVGAPIKLTFYHPEEPTRLIRKDITRELITFDSVEGFEVDKGILTLQIHEFQKKTPDEIRTFLSKKKYDAIILDLRNNFGGLFLSGIETAELFLPIGLIAITKDQRGRILEKYVSHESRKIEEKVLVVLINRFSASSAEIVAGSLKDRQQGIIVGERSFGKGVAQTIFPINEKLYLKLSTSRFFMPSGTSFSETGIEPDYYIQDSTETLRYQATDTIFQKALEIVKERLNQF